MHIQCNDILRFFAVHDCIVSEWGPWSPCPLIIQDQESVGKDRSEHDETDDEDDEIVDCSDDNAAPSSSSSPPTTTSADAAGTTFSVRRRVVLHESQNGGRKCPVLDERRPCSDVPSRSDRERRRREKCRGGKDRGERTDVDTGEPQS